MRWSCPKVSTPLFWLYLTPQQDNPYKSKSITVIEPTFYKALNFTSFGEALWEKIHALGEG